MTDKLEYKALNKRYKAIHDTISDFMEIYRNDTKSISDAELRLDKKIIDLDARMKKIELVHKNMLTALYSFQDDTANRVAKAAEDAIKPVQDKTDKMFSSKAKIIHYIHQPSVFIKRTKLAGIIALFIFGIIIGGIAAFYFLGGR